MRVAFSMNRPFLRQLVLAAHSSRVRVRRPRVVLQVAGRFPQVCQPVVRRGLRAFYDHVERFHGLQLEHDFVQGSNGLGAAQVKDYSFAVIKDLQRNTATLLCSWF